jgi:hypothetical protein
MKKMHLIPKEKYPPEVFRCHEVKFSFPNTGFHAPVFYNS